MYGLKYSNLLATNRSTYTKIAPQNHAATRPNLMKAGESPTHLPIKLTESHI